MRIDIFREIYKKYLNRNRRFLEIRKFNLDEVDGVCHIIGNRASGKSTLVKDILYHKRDIPSGVVISETEGSTSFYSRFIPSMFIHHQYSAQMLENFVTHSKVIMRLGRADSRSFLVCDDVPVREISQDRNIKFIFMNGKHIKNLCILTTQDGDGGYLPLVLKCNTDYVFIFTNTKWGFSHIKKIWSDYGSMFTDYCTFCDVLNECTKDYGCMVIKKKACSDKLEDQVFWYKAELHDDFVYTHRF